MSKANEIECKNLEVAIARIVMGHPFYATILLRLPRVQDMTCKTAWTDGTRIGYNPAFFNSLTSDQVMGTLMHEVEHVVRMHHLRRGERDGKQWNVACDHVINPDLVDGGMELPPGVLLDKQWKGKSAEEVYAMLPPPPEGGGDGDGEGDGDGHCDLGEVRPHPDANDEAGRAQAEQEVQVAANQAARVAKAQGSMPAHVERMVGEMNAPKVTWQEELREYMERLVKGDSNWARPDRRHAHAGLFLPSPSPEQAMGSVVIALDTSGSIDGPLLDEFMSEVNSILEGVVPETVYVVSCDAQVHQVEVFEEGEFPIEAHPVGGGGTRFEPVWEWMQEEQIEPDVVVYFTDLYGSFGEDPQVPVVWAVYDNDRDTAPFGKTIHITR